MLLKYFYNHKLAHASYMVGCQATGEAMIIDPGRDISIYLTAAKREEMTIVGTAETHIHADYVSGARELAASIGAKLFLSDEGDENWKYTYADQYAHRLLKDGDTFDIGHIRFEVMHTPGHTPEHLAYLLTDMGGGANRPMGIFSGDFVFVGSVGRPDLLEKAAGLANTSIIGAKQMFASLQRFKQLPDYLQVWPAHGAGSACGKGLGAIPSSTVGYEKLFNPALNDEDEAAFVTMLLDGQPEPPPYFAVMKRVNKEGPMLLGKQALPDRLPAEQLLTILETGGMVVDTRSEWIFAAAHVPGTINIPHHSLSSWAGWFVDYERPLYLIADNDVMEMVRDLAYIGIDNVAGYFEAAAVDTLAYARQSYRNLTAREVSDRILNGDLLVVDVRAQTEWEAGHIPGARHIMLGTLAERADEVLNGQTVIVQCESGFRSAIGASILQAKGAASVINMRGGFLGWVAEALPVEK